MCVFTSQYKRVALLCYMNAFYLVVAYGGHLIRRIMLSLLLNPTSDSIHCDAECLGFLLFLLWRWDVIWNATQSQGPCADRWLSPNHSSGHSLSKSSVARCVFCEFVGSFPYLAVCFDTVQWGSKRPFRCSRFGRSPHENTFREKNAILKRKYDGWVWWPKQCHSSFPQSSFPSSLDRVLGCSDNGTCVAGHEYFGYSTTVVNSGRIDLLYLLFIVS